MSRGEAHQSPEMVKASGFQSSGNRSFGYQEFEGPEISAAGVTKSETPKHRDRPTGGHVASDQGIGKSRKGHFGIPGTGECKGKEFRILDPRDPERI
jgi:hypothetical protein